MDKLDIAAGGRCTMWHVSFRLVLVVDNCLRDYVSYSQLSWHAREATHSLWDLAAPKCVTESGVLPGIQEEQVVVVKQHCIDLGIPDSMHAAQWPRGPVAQINEYCRVYTVCRFCRSVLP